MGELMMIRIKVRPSWAMALLALSGPLFAAANQVRVVAESDLQHWWQADPASPNQPVRYPIEALKSGIEGCMVVAYEINSEGGVSNERIWLNRLPRFSYLKAMEQSAVLTIHHWHFTPATENVGREAVYTYQTLAYTITGSSTKWTKYDAEREAKMKAECKIPDFPQQVQAMIRNDAQTVGGHP